MRPLKKTSCHIFKMDIFSKFFADVMTQIIRKNAVKRIKKIKSLLGVESPTFLNKRALSTWQQKKYGTNYQIPRLWKYAFILCKFRNVCSKHASLHIIHCKYIDCRQHNFSLYFISYVHMFFKCIFTTHEILVVNGNHCSIYKFY